MASADGKGRSRKRQVIVNENSPLIKAFRAYQTELDTKHDRYERLVKLSRDITIESKRAIFLLQRCAGEDFDEKQDVLQQAFTKLKEIQKTKFLPVALELEGHDHYQFIRAYSPGLQEYIEAVSFYQYLHNGELVTLSEVEKDLRFFRPLAHDCSQQKTDSGHGKEVHSTDVSSTSDSSMKSDIDISSKQGKEAGCTPTEVSSSSNTGSAMNSDTQDLMKSDINDIISVTVPPMEFMLGIADLTGELMRTAIMSVSAGNLDYPVQICKFMRIIHESFMSYGNAARELTRKMATLRQSLEKVENACYTLKVRGSEIPKHMLADIFTSPTVEGSFAEDMENSAYD